jgi:1,2-dihydroxy-3-keto-5-methylthiopentene dioxygenase
MSLEAWYMDDSDADQRLPHQTDPVQYVSREKLDQLGVLQWSGLTGEDDPRLAEIRSERGYNYKDLIHCCPEKLEGYEQKIAMFYLGMFDCYA